MGKGKKCQAFQFLAMVTFFILIPILALGQSATKDQFENGNPIGKSKIELGYTTIMADEIVKSDSVIYYSLPKEDVQYSVSFSDVESIDKFVGDKSNTGLLFGAIIGGLASIPVIYGTKKEETEIDGSWEVTTTTYQLWPSYVMSLAGGLLGYVIGKGNVEWENIYKNDGFSNRNTTASVSPTVLYSGRSGNAKEVLTPGISVHFKF